MNNVGIDLVEFEEIKERISDKFIERILSNDELEIYNKITQTQRKLAFLAGRFAAKEAYTKAYKTFDDELNFKDVSILNDRFGAPYIKSKYHPEDTLTLSISHSRHYAVAICIKENDE
ncbi:MAG: holo-ACP synthase [Candidatus Izimaplasma sp.]|nr:holo-ACP synthase [Candidatus Izimaplasma bacterium]